MVIKPKNISWRTARAIIIFALLLSCIYLGIGFFSTPDSRNKSTQPEMIFPESLQGDFIFLPDDLPEENRSAKILFDVNEEGQPFLMFADKFIGLMHENSPAMAFSLTGTEKFDGFSWMRDGSLMLISGRKLGVYNKNGFQELLELPEEEMLIRPASADQFYLFGGNSISQRKNLYLYRKSGEMLLLASADSPINDVCGYGEITFIAAGKSIYLIASGKPLSLAYETDDEVIFLAIAPSGGLFYSTATEVGYITRSNRGYTFIKGLGAKLRVGGEDLYLFFADKSLLKCNPASSFEGLAESFNRLQ